MHHCFCFISIQLAIFVQIKLIEDLGDNTINSSTEAVRDRVIKIIVLSKVEIRVEEHLKVVVHIVDDHLPLVTQVFSIDAHDLRQGIVRSTLALRAPVDDLQLASTHVGVLSFVGLDAASLFGVAKHASHAHQVVDGRVTDPCDVD